MRDEIKALKVCGGNFVPETCLQLFQGIPSNQKKVACSVLYGRNGSGKSTIATQIYLKLFIITQKHRKMSRVMG